jgi:hypothetical protein
MLVRTGSECGDNRNCFVEGKAVKRRARTGLNWLRISGLYEEVGTTSGLRRK